MVALRRILERRLLDIKPLAMEQGSMLRTPFNEWCPQHRIYSLFVELQVLILIRHSFRLI